MKQFFYAVFALLCNLSCRFCALKENRVLLLSMHNEQLCDSLGAVRDALMKDGRFEIIVLTRQDLSLRRPLRVLRFFFVRSHQLATAKYIFLNDNFMPLGLLHLRKEAVVTQLWHAEGVFKKFGLSMEQPPAVREKEIAGNRKLTYVVCSSETVKPFYAEAFGVRPQQVLPLGAPRADALLQPGAKERARQALLEQYPALKGKTLVLYAPTFRNLPEENDALLERVDAAAFRASLGEDYALLTRFHPQIHPKKRALPGALDLTDYPDAATLVAACDVLVTDYSSVCMEAALLGIKTIFFAFDLEQYKAERDFYFDYESYVPGPVVRTFPALLQAIRQPADEEKTARFCAFNFGEPDGKSTERVLKAVFKND